MIRPRLNPDCTTSNLNQHFVLSIFLLQTPLRSPSKPLPSRPHIKLMHPQITLLAHHLQIQSPHTLAPHLLPLQHLLRILALPLHPILSRDMVLIRDPPVRNAVHDMHALGTELARKGLRQHAHPAPSRAVRRIPRVRAQRTQRPRENQRAPLLQRQLVFVPRRVLVEHPLETQLGEIHRAGHVDFETVGELVRGFVEEGRAVRVFDAPEREFEFEIGGDALGPGFDLVECTAEFGPGGVGLEGLEDPAVRRGGDFLREGVCYAAGEESHGEIALGWVSEDAGDAGARGGTGAENDGET